MRLLRLDPPWIFHKPRGGKVQLSFFSAAGHCNPTRRVLKESRLQPPSSARLANYGRIWILSSKLAARADQVGGD
jgi:hypothetical protein